MTPSQSPPDDFLVLKVVVGRYYSGGGGGTVTSGTPLGLKGGSGSSLFLREGKFTVVPVNLLDLKVRWTIIVPPWREEGDDLTTVSSR